MLFKGDVSAGRFCKQNELAPGLAALREEKILIESLYRLTPGRAAGFNKVLKCSGPDIG
jgi:hypothetical protein